MKASNGKTIMMTTCKGCGIEMTQYQHQSNRKNGLRKRVYCTKECYLAHVKTSTIFRCKMCGKKGIVQKMRKSLGQGKYCGRECFKKDKVLLEKTRIALEKPLKHNSILVNNSAVRRQLKDLYHI